ncbi:MAG: hypothetical protein LQ350_006411 [Teloschistes chrysophthalmus]|nr:MAG: hypothetical protein LQ350_006411 [Niorma chrysophthalma]
MSYPLTPSKAVLSQNLIETIRPQRDSTSPSRPANNEVETVKLSTVSDPRPVISESLHQSVDEISSLSSAGANARIYANPEGKSISADLDDLKASVAHIKSEVTSLRSQVTTLRSEVTALKTEHKSQKIMLELIKPNSLQFYAVRRRFLDGFKRDYLDTPALRHPPGNDMLKLGDQSAHDADVVADALLYKMDERTDGYTFRRLYGLDFRHFLELSRSQIPYSIQNVTITELLDDYANLIVKQNLRLPAKRDAYRAFIHAVENNRLSDPATNFQIRNALQDYYNAP